MQYRSIRNPHITLDFARTQNLNNHPTYIRISTTKDSCELRQRLKYKHLVILLCDVLVKVELLIDNGLIADSLSWGKPGLHF